MPTATSTRCRDCFRAVDEIDDGDNQCTDCMRFAAYTMAEPCICFEPVRGAPIFRRVPCIRCFRQVTS